MKDDFCWLNRRVARPGPYLTLCLSEDELRRASKKITDAKLNFPLSGALCSTFLNQKTNELCAIVSVSQQSQKNANSIEMAGLLVHEAVHVWQRYAEHMGESQPGCEQEAYAVQAISQELMNEYARRLGLKKKSRRRSEN